MKIIIDNVISKLIIGGKDNLKGNVFGDAQEFMKTKVPNAYHIKKANKNLKHWDGCHKFLSDAGDFPTGFLPMVLDFLSTYELETEIEDRRKNLPVFKRIEDWDIATHEFTLHPHQVSLAQSLIHTIEYQGKHIYFPRGIWDAAPNSGKTGALAVAVNNTINPKVLFLVDAQFLFEQQYEFYKGMFGDIGYIGKLGNGTAKVHINPFFTIAMVETLAKRIKKDLTLAKWLKNDVNFLVADESHTCMSSTAGQLISKDCNAGIRLFMSGTPLSTSDKLTNLKFVGMSGSKLKKISKRWLMDNKYSLEPEINIYINPTPVRYGLSYVKEESLVITESDTFADFVADLVYQRRDKKVWVTYWAQAHGELMYRNFITKYPKLAHLAAVVHSDTPDRREIIKSYIANKIKYLFGSTILQQGVNIKDIQSIINCVGGKSDVQVSQSGGRGERLDGSSTTYEWVDFYHKGDYCGKHSTARFKMFIKEGFTVNYKYEADKRGKPKK